MVHLAYKGDNASLFTKDGNKPLATQRWKHAFDHPKLMTHLAAKGGEAVLDTQKGETHLTFYRWHAPFVAKGWKAPLAKQSRNTPFLEQKVGGMYLESVTDLELHILLHISLSYFISSNKLFSR